MTQEPVGGSEPGDVMVMSTDASGKVKKSSNSYDSQIVGAVTTYGRGTSYNDLDYDVFYDQNSRSQNPLWANVGMLGQIYIKVSLENGAINAGDPLTTSSQEGVAMKAMRPGRIVGWAIQPWTGSETRDSIAPQQQLPSGTGMILAFVHPTWYDTGQNLNLTDIAINGILSAPEGSIDGFTSDISSPQRYSLTDKLGKTIEGAAVYADAAIANLKAGGIDASSIQTNSLTAKGFSLEGDDGLKKISFDAKGNAFFAGTLTADKIVANKIEGLEILTNKISALGVNIASVEAQLNLLSPPESTQSGQTEIAPTPSNLTLTSLNIEGIATISADLHVWGSSIIQGVLNVIDSITTNNLVVGKWADFLNSVIFRGDVNFLGRPTFNKDTAGTAIIKKDSDRVVITFDREYVQVPVVTANMVFGEINEKQIFDQNYSLIISQRTTKGFSIVLNKPAVSDLTFSWLAFAVKDEEPVQNSVLDLSPTATQSATPTVTIVPTPTQTPTPTIELLNPTSQPTPINSP
jgi:hypothetical protein